jgi:hypothetical protein
MVWQKRGRLEYDELCSGSERTSSPGGKWPWWGHRLKRRRCRYISHQLALMKSFCKPTTAHLKHNGDWTYVVFSVHSLGSSGDLIGSSNHYCYAHWAGAFSINKKMKQKNNTLYDNFQKLKKYISYLTEHRYKRVSGFSCTWLISGP